MVGSSTTAVIYGCDNFVAVKLEARLKEQGIKVIRGDYEDIPANVVYFFDFLGNEAAWERLNKNQRLVAIQINSDNEVKGWENVLRRSELNWRIVVGENVYGEGMEEGGFLGRAFLLAARNKNLILPSLQQIYRVLAVDDFVEAILRSCFFSGTSGRILVVGGKEINSKIVAEVLVEEAKMTKTQVIQDEAEVPAMDSNYVAETEEVLRWEPEITFTEGAKPVVQYFVAKADTEDRRKPIVKNIPKQPQQIKRESVERRFEVEIEEEPEEKEIEIEEKKEKIEEEIIEKEAEVQEAPTAKDEFKLERLRISPLPERKYERRTEEDEEMDKAPSSKFKPLSGSWSGWAKEDESEDEILPTTPPKRVETENISVAANPVKEIIEKKNNFFGKLPKIKIKFKKIELKSFGGWKWGFWGVLGIFFIVFLVNVINVVMIPKKIAAVESLIAKGKYTEATKEINDLTKGNEKMLQTFGGGNVGIILRAEGEVLDLLKLSLDLSQSGEKISQGLFGEKDISMKSELQKVETNLDEVISKMGILQGRLSGQWNNIPGRYREDIIKLRDKLASEREMAENARRIIPVLPEILGLDGKRREYMVLLQNENELRPTGGFIGSYAILSFEGGKFLGFDVKDVYEADGQLKGHVEPPAEIKKYLGEAAWFMRDSNWQASFPLVSKDVQWFLEKETGRKVDGVIGLNLASVKAILKVTGEIYVTDFKEKINDTNLYEQAEYYSETKFFAGSVQKASFLGAVSKQLMEEIKTAKGKEGQELMVALVDLLNRNEIQIALNEPNAATVLLDAGWDGSIYEGKCNGDKCLADYLYIVEANLGVNKANYFLYRNIERQIEIGEKLVKNNLKIVYENTAKSSAWPGGDYKNYVRIYVPVEASLQEVNWSENGSGERKIISGEDLKINQVGNKKEIGFLITVPIGKKINVEVKYIENVKLTGLDKFSYLNYIQRQSGYGDTGMVTLVTIPENWQINAVEPAASVVGGKLLFNQKLDRDIKMGVEISR